VTEPRRRMGCIDMTFLVAVPGGYALLMLLLGRWVARLLGVGFLAVALPLAVVPIPIALGKHWKSSWIFVVPVAATVLVARRWAAVGDWRGAVGGSFTTAFVWLLTLLLIAGVVRKVGAVVRRVAALVRPGRPEG
jgi:hypothetical protein